MHAFLREIPQNKSAHVVKISASVYFLSVFTEKWRLSNLQEQTAVSEVLQLS